MADYTQASCEHVLSQVRVPLLLLSARNDPIAPADIIKAAPIAAATDATVLLAGKSVSERVRERAGDRLNK